MRLLAPNAEERMDICKGCPFFKPKGQRCGKCGCFMLAKTKLLKSKCPIDKWGCPDCEVK